MKKNLILPLLFTSFIINGCEDVVLDQTIDNDVISRVQEAKTIKNSRIGGCLTGYGLDNNSNPVGGGYGYSDIVDKNDATVVVYNLAELIDELDNATENSIIYIDDTTEIEISTAAIKLIPIKKGVTLASGRGNSNGSCGALIKTDVYGVNGGDERTEIFELKGPNSRITGIRFEGPFGDVGSNSSRNLKRAINTNGSESVIIDNCEFYNWPESAVNVGGKSYSDVKILNNYFHSNKQDGWGYGVVVVDGFALIKGNLFYNNRHDISTSGLRGSGYEAAFNYVAGQGTSHNFDVHGGQDASWTGNDADISGTFIHIHHNTFADDLSMNGSKNLAIKIRGIPTYMCLIENNKFKHDRIKDAIGQFYTGKGVEIRYKENVLAWNNIYNWSGTDGYYKGWYASRNWGFSNAFADLTYESDILMDFQLGDFDGNGKTEIFKIDSGEWFTTEIPSEGFIATENKLASLTWDRINFAPGFSISLIRFGDFDADGSTDAFKSNGQDWYISRGGRTSWAWINHSPGYTVDKIKIGNFNANGSTDVFRTNGEWFISDGGQSPWARINNAPGFDLNDLRFGDFDGDGSTDVFKTNGTNWHISRGGQTNWELINVSGYNLDHLFFADVDNDGSMDVVRKYNYHFFISWGGSSGWEELTYEQFPTLLSGW